MFKDIRSNFKVQLGLVLIVLSFLISCRKDPEIVVEEETDYSFLLAGNNTIFSESSVAFSFPDPGLTGFDELNFFAGNSFFNDNWVTAPSITTARDGLGPLINARSCSSCHSRDGRGRPANSPNEIGSGLLLRLSIGENSDGSPIPHPVYGSQLQDGSILGVPSEGKLGITYEEFQGSFSDGEQYSLRKPTYFVRDPQFGPLGDVKISPRIARQIIGMGYLEAISEDSILANADEFDFDGDGISGKPNYVWDDFQQTISLGRIGWKADQPSVAQQTAKAFLRDIGITTPVYPIETCTDSQQDCKNAENGGVPEIDSVTFDDVVLYASNLAVPAQRNYRDEKVKLGKSLFESIGCVKCHDNFVITSSHERFQHLNNQIIRPYSDLLLHDMGEGLADGFPFYKATGSEWRTPPLWGIGLFEAVNNHTYYLHDGRARNLKEAILWHGGEAHSKKNAFKDLSKENREALLLFLKSL
jgi:CxxC motif-containing protein (DUF1111 family)